MELTAKVTVILSFYLLIDDGDLYGILPAAGQAVRAHQHKRRNSVGS